MTHQMEMEYQSGINVCPQCGSTELRVDVHTGKLMCAFCHTNIDEAVVGASEHIHELSGDTISTGASQIEQDTKHLVTFECKNCHEKIVFDANESATARCPWCRNVFVSMEQIPNGKMPDLVLPFKVTKQDAVVKINEYVSKRRRYANPDFKREYDAQNVMGVYLPYMVVDINAHVKLSGIGEIGTGTHHAGSDGNGSLVYDADRYRVNREFDIAIDDLTIEASEEKLKQDYYFNTTNVINSVMPFDTENCVKWTPYHLTGYSMERRDIEVDNLYEPVKNQAFDVCRTKALETGSEYDRGVFWEESNMKMNGTDWKFAQMPVWLYSYVEKLPETDDRGQMLHYVAVNARTGKTMGSIPIYKPKLVLHNLLIGLFAWAAGIAWFIFLFHNDFELRLGGALIIAIAPEVVFYLTIRKKYRNDTARFAHETEVRSTITNLVSSDTFERKITSDKSRLAKNDLTGVNIHNTSIFDIAAEKAKKEQEEKEAEKARREAEKQAKKQAKKQK